MGDEIGGELFAGTILKELSVRYVSLSRMTLPNAESA